MMRYIPPILFLGTMALAVPTASAQVVPTDGSPHGMVAVGAGIVPEFDGAQDMRAVPFVLGDVRWGDVTMEFRGLRARVDLASDPRLSAGPLIGPRLGRNDADGAVGRLPEIDMAVEAGAFVGYRFGGERYGQGSVQVELSLAHDVSNTHNGLIVTASASYAAVRTTDFFLSVDAQSSWTNADYARTYFGVDRAGATASGLDLYRPGAGFRDIGGGMSAGYWFSPRFGVMARAGVNYLVGDIADSPITDEGRSLQPMAALALSYRF